MNTILFDLDGTLLPMDKKGFTDTYMKAIVARFVEYGASGDRIAHAVWAGVEAMKLNDGFLTNEDAFWNTFSRDISGTGEPISSEDLKFFKKEISKFYKKDFFVTRLNTWAVPEVRECIAMLKSKGYRLVVATDPIFPLEATLARIDWAGLDPNDFEYITSMENSCFCKPSANYYKKVLSAIGASSEECLMVGNDVFEDMAAIKAGIDVFLVDDCLENIYDIDVTDYKKGSFRAFYEFALELPRVY